MSGRVDVGSPRSLNCPIQPGNDGEADTGRERIDRKIFKPRMPSGGPDLQDFDDTDRHDRDR